MKRILMSTGLVLMLAAGTASAQTSVRLSIGFEAPRPYVSGYVLIGRPHVRPVYRPFYHHHYHGRRRVIVVAAPVVRPPRVVLVDPRHGRRFRHHRHHD